MYRSNNLSVSQTTVAGSSSGSGSSGSVAAGGANSSSATTNISIVGNEVLSSHPENRHKPLDNSIGRLSLHSITNKF